MATQVLVNLCIGFLWMFFQDDWSILSFSSGYFFGILVIYILRRFFKSKFYLYTLQAMVRLLFIFTYELFVSSILVMKKILAPKIDIKPGIVAMETSLESDVEVTLVSLLLTLTPGSVVMHISEDNKVLYLHVMDIPELSNAVLASKERFEEAIKKVTRS